MDRLGIEMPKSEIAHSMEEAVFPFNMFPEVDPVLGPGMSSTGKVLGLAEGGCTHKFD